MTGTLSGIVKRVTSYQLLIGLSFMLSTACATSGNGAGEPRGTVDDEEITVVIPLEAGTGGEKSLPVDPQEFVIQAQEERISADNLREALVTSMRGDWRHGVLAVLPTACTARMRGAPYAFYLYNADRDKETIDLTEELNEAVWHFISLPSVRARGLVRRATVQVRNTEKQQWRMTVTLHTTKWPLETGGRRCSRATREVAPAACLRHLLRT
jgi:hypothetical protein